jgi:epoxyqueuosine reductase
MSASIKDDLLRYARSLGFDRVGVTSTEPLIKDESYLKEWLAQGFAGEMAYLHREPERRARPTELLPGARSVIMLAMPHFGERESGREGEEGRIARYARGPDYHKVIRKRLESLVRYLESLAPEARFKTFVDTRPILERALAQRAGVGFIGKNTTLITKDFGSWVHLAGVVTTLDLPPDPPDERSCGSCRLCLEACPTGALTAPYTLDARRCLSYQTTVLKNKTGEWVLGCDVCQEACPHNASSGRIGRKIAAFRGPGSAGPNEESAIPHSEREGCARRALSA